MPDDWDLTVSAQPKAFEFKLRELIRYRDLVYMFFLRDWKTTYKQTILGPLWYLINPLCSTVVYSFVFNRLAGISTDGIPRLLFHYGGTMLWTYYTSCLTTASVIFVNNSGVFGKVYFPRLTVPLATTFNMMFRMLIQFAMLLVFMAYYLAKGAPIRPGAGAVLFPFLVIWLGALGTSLGMAVSALTTKYRDLNHVINLLIQLTMYVTPVVYPMSEVPARYKPLFYLNPVSAPLELFRVWFYGAGSVPPLMALSSLGLTALCVFGGLALFTRTSRNFLDVI